MAGPGESGGMEAGVLGDVGEEGEGVDCWAGGGRTGVVLIDRPAIPAWITCAGGAAGAGG